MVMNTYTLGFYHFQVFSSELSLFSLQCIFLWVQVAAVFGKGQGDVELTV